MERLSQLTFAESRDEVGFMVYFSRYSQSTSTTFHTVQSICWAIGLSRLWVTAYANHPADGLRGGERLQFIILAAAYFVAIIVHWICAERISAISKVKDYVSMERIKAVVSIVDSICCMVAVIMLRDEDVHLFSPLNAVVFAALLQMTDMVRVDTAWKLHGLRFIAFICMEVDRGFRFYELSKKCPCSLVKTTIYSLTHEFAWCLAFGVLLPLLLASFLEAEMRLSFLQRTRRSLTKIGPFWRRMLEVPNLLHILTARRQPRQSFRHAYISQPLHSVGNDIRRPGKYDYLREDSRALSV